MLNPYKRIRELEREVEIACLARVKAEDECRLLHAQLSDLKDSESTARKALAAKSDRIEDWMAAMLGRPSLNGNEFPRPAAPAPSRRPTSHGAAIEQEMIAQYEKELGIDRAN